MKKVYVCSDTVEGILSAVYDAWPASREEKECTIALRGREEPMLFCEYVEVTETAQKARTVERMIRKNLGVPVYRELYYAMLSPEADKAAAILGTMQSARKIPDGRRVMEYLSNPWVTRVFELSRSVGKEAHNLQGFLRFRMLDVGVLYAPITPKAQVITCLAPFFEDRMPLENWMIHDRTHGMFAVHEAGKRWVLTAEEGLEERWGRSADFSEEEDRYGELWRGFCRAVSIESRENPRCQLQHLPLRYRPNMTEFQTGAASTPGEILPGCWGYDKIVP